MRRGGITERYEVKYIQREQYKGGEKCGNVFGNIGKIQTMVFWGKELLPQSKRTALGKICVCRSWVILTREIIDNDLLQSLHLGVSWLRVTMSLSSQRGKGGALIRSRKESQHFCDMPT